MNNIKSPDEWGCVERALTFPQLLCLRPRTVVLDLLEDMNEHATVTYIFVALGTFVYYYLLRWFRPSKHQVRLCFSRYTHKLI